VTAAVALIAFLPANVGLLFAALLGLRFLFGAFQAGGFPVIGRIVADWMPVAERGFAQGTIWMLSRLGGFLVPFLIVWLFRWSGGWPIPFVVIGSLGLVWCAAFWPWFRNRPAEMAHVSKGELARIAAGRALEQAPARSTSVPWARLLSSRSVWALCLMYGCTGFSGNFFTNMLPLYLSEHRRLDEDATKWLSALPLLAGVAACILGGSSSDWIIRRWGNRQWGRRAVGALGLTLASVAFLSAGSSSETWLLGLLLTLTFFGNDLTMGPAWASCADIGERYAGTLSGTMNMIGAFMGAAGTALTGYLLRHGRPELVFVIFAAVYLLAALSWLGVDANERLTAQS
jgi:sugar phosphate permease